MVIDKMRFQFISTSDPKYSEELVLRWEVLSKPLGLPPGSEIITEEEDKSLHLVAVQGKKVVGCVLYYPENEAEGRLYQMAVSEDYQGKGFGRKLIHSLEQELAKRGVKEVHLNASQEAIGFYMQMGYHPQGEPFFMKGISHQLLKKTISQRERVVFHGSS